MKSKPIKPLAPDARFALCFRACDGLSDDAIRRVTAFKPRLARLNQLTYEVNEAVKALKSTK